jgi:hypothetical protein
VLKQYYYNTPTTYIYVVQLDQNQAAKDSETPLAESDRMAQTFPAAGFLINLEKRFRAWP